MRRVQSPLLLRGGLSLLQQAIERWIIRITMASRSIYQIVIAYQKIASACRRLMIQDIAKANVKVPLNL